MKCLSLIFRLFLSAALLAGSLAPNAWSEPEKSQPAATSQPADRQEGSACHMRVMASHPQSFPPNSKSSGTPHSIPGSHQCCLAGHSLAIIAPVRAADLNLQRTPVTSDPRLKQISCARSKGVSPAQLPETPGQFSLRI